MRGSPLGTDLVKCMSGNAVETPDLCPLTVMQLPASHFGGDLYMALAQVLAEGILHGSFRHPPQRQRTDAYTGF